MDNYYDTLDQEILETVYYYHNKINNIDLYTIGCELSEWDGERIVELLNTQTEKHTVVFNTCAVTERAQKASEILIKLLTKLYKDSKIYITGCGVDYNFDYYKNYGTCLKNEHKFDCKSYNDKYKQILNNEFDHHRHNCGYGLVKIQDGCHHHCTYCIINKLRKNPFSVSYEDISNQIKQLLSKGQSRIILLGTEICFYYHNNLKISNLVDKILTDFPSIECLGLGAIDPASREVEKLIDLYEKYPNQLDNVFTLSVQSCCDEILRKMKRRHNVKRLFDLNDYAKRKNVYFAYHIIPGFPGETNELFQITINNLKILKPVYIHSMAFSARKGTPAYDMPDQIDFETLKYREQYLVDLIEDFRHSDNYPLIKNQIQFGQEDVYFARMNFYPDKEKRIQFNIYDIDSIIKTIKNLLQADTNYDTVLEYTYDENIDDDILETHAKFLTFNYGVKLVAKIYLNDTVISKMLLDRLSIVNFVITKSSFIDFYIDIEKTKDIKNLVKFLLKIKNKYDISKLVTIINNSQIDQNFKNKFQMLIGDIL